MFDCAEIQATCRRIVRLPALNSLSHPPGGQCIPAEPPLRRPRPVLRLLAQAGLMLALMAPLSQARAQEPVLGRGDAVVTGFAGIKPADAPLKPGANPIDEFFIDVNGPSAQILSLAVPGGAPAGQLISPPAKLQLKASQIGQVFAAALDDGQGAKVPNIYLGATSAYGLNIVVPDADGNGWPERVKTGQPTAQWMTGQFGVDLGGGPGSIYKVDGQTGAVSLFATLPGNSGPGIGDIVFDAASRQFFASDLDTGLIHRLGNGGDIIDSFDHGVAGRPAKGLAPVSDDGRQANIENGDFNSDDPASWGYTQDERRVYGLAIHDSRLYYAAGGQIWSIGISAEGFAKDARWELDAKSDGPITDMLFDGQGRLYLAQRGAQRASYDYSVFAEPEKAAVMRYVRETPDDPSTESAWVAEPDSYAIGLPPEHNHAEGGIALGYAHDETGALRYGACGETLWSTGHRLRQSAIAEGGEGEGEADVHGLQGNAASLVRPQNVPPQQSYFADYDGFFGDAAKAGHMGDVEIWQPCDGAPAQTFGELPPGIVPLGDVPPEGEPDDWPYDDFETNLKLTKRATPHTCLPWVNGWLCKYTIRVTNTGPDNFFGPIVVDDRLPGTPAGAIMGFSPTPPWHCWVTGADERRCRRLGVFLAASGGSVDLTAYIWVPKAKDRCRLRNAAEIHRPAGGTQWNTDPSDDADDATALIPDPDCKDHPQRSDLKIEKRAFSCFRWQGQIRCGYRVTVENLGPGAYSGDIAVDETIPPGTTPIFSGNGWGCIGGGTHYTCTYQNANLPVNGTKSFFVRLDFTAAQAKEMHCKVRNHVKITEAPGNTPKNTDPSNDIADAVGIVPDEICNKPLTSNLRISKKASPTFCERSGSDWWCSYLIRVWNTGPGKYDGPITVEEALPAQPVDATWNLGWTCTGLGGNGAECKHGNVSLNTNQSRWLSLKVKFSGADVRAKNCLMPNVAKITDAAPGSPKNSNAGDDIAGDTAKVPAWFCHQPPPEPTDLELIKWGAQAVGCNAENGKWRCPWVVNVKNVGNANYHGKIVVKDWLPAGVSGATMQEQGGVWACDSTTSPVTCTHPQIDLAAAQTVFLQMYVFVDPSKYDGCSLTNTAKILQAPGGSVQNTNAGNDQGQSTLTFQPLLANGKSYCYTPVPNTACPPGFRWGGDSCDRIGTGTPPPPRTCPPGTVGDYPDCDPVGQHCPEGTVGDYPNCRQVEQHCPRGTVGDYPNCQPIGDDGDDDDRDCPRGLVGTYPNCHKPGGSTPECTDGRVRRGSQCVCPGSLVWNGDRCVRRQCPEGMRGRFPNCHKVIVEPKKCRAGTFGRWPNCKTIEKKHCPPGTVGKYPRCRKIERHCPDGMVGRPPHCRFLNREKQFRERPNLFRKPNFGNRLQQRQNFGRQR